MTPRGPPPRGPPRPCWGWGWRTAPLLLSARPGAGAPPCPLQPHPKPLSACACAPVAAAAAPAAGAAALPLLPAPLLVAVGGDGALLLMPLALLLLLRSAAARESCGPSRVEGARAPAHRAWATTSPSPRFALRFAARKRLRSSRKSRVSTCRVRLAASSLCQDTFFPAPAPQQRHSAQALGNGPTRGLRVSEMRHSSSTTTTSCTSLGVRRAVAHNLRSPRRSRPAEPRQHRSCVPGAGPHHVFHAWGAARTQGSGVRRRRAQHVGGRGAPPAAGRDGRARGAAQQGHAPRRSEDSSGGGSSQGTLVPLPPARPSLPQVPIEGVARSNQQLVPSHLQGAHSSCAPRCRRRSTSLPAAPARRST